MSTLRGDRRRRVAYRIRRHHRGRCGSVDCCNCCGLRVPINVCRHLVCLNVDGDRRRHDDMINSHRIVRACVICDPSDLFDAPRTSCVGCSRAFFADVALRSLHDKGDNHNDLGAPAASPKTCASAFLLQKKEHLKMRNVPRNSAFYFAGFLPDSSRTILV